MDEHKLERETNLEKECKYEQKGKAQEHKLRRLTNQDQGEAAILMVVKKNEKQNSILKAKDLKVWNQKKLKRKMKNEKK